MCCIGLLCLTDGFATLVEEYTGLISVLASAVTCALGSEFRQREL